MIQLDASLSGIGGVSASLKGIDSLTVALSKHGSISASLSGVSVLNGELQGTRMMIGELTLPKGKASPPFTGAYIYTPTQNTQTIPINGFKAIEDITIEPIPSNYGLITWNGSTITVS